VSQVPATLEPAARPWAVVRRRTRSARAPLGLTVLSAAVALLLLLPLIFLVVEAHQVGWSALRAVLFRQLTASLLWGTISLTATVTVFCVVIGTLAAFFVERTDLPLRRLWAVLVVVPVGIPDFLEAFGWKSIFPGLGGFWGAVLIMTFAVYPLVFLPVAASLRHADPGQEEVARGLGAGRLRTFFRVTLGQAKVAVLGGAVLVALVVLAEYGAFEIVGYRTFTTEIFTEINVGFNEPAACALSLVLVVISLIVLAGDLVARGRGRSAALGPMTKRAPVRHRLGRFTWPMLAAFALLVTCALGIPLGAIVYWWLQGGVSTLPPASILSASGHTALYSAGGALLATALSLPVAVLVERHRSKVATALERSTYLVLAIAGVVIALGLTFFAERYAFGFLYQSAYLLVMAYAIMFFPLALVAVRASLAQVPPSLEEVGRSLGQSRFSVLWRVTLPLIGPGLAAAFCLVFLEAVTELTATLILVPLNAHTLATEFWAYETNLSYGQAAPYAGLMVLIAAVPSYVLARWFDRLPSETAVS
jgi:iron(III) transport system permease protein